MDKHELVLDRLQPHENLKELTIEGYNEIRLDHLPPLRKLPFLERFDLTGMPAIKKLDFQCPQLKDLHICYMEGLEELSGSGMDAGQWHPRHHTLRVTDCPKLEVLPSLSLSIRKIYLDNLGLVSLLTLWLDRNSTCSTSGSSLSSLLLQELKVVNFGKITSLDQGLLQLQHYLTALVHLEIQKCPELVDFPSGCLKHLQALQILYIFNCPKLQVAPDGNDDKFIPLRLRPLVIREGCAELMRSIPTLLKGIFSLGRLFLKKCEELVLLDGLMGLQSIEDLRIKGCSKLAHVAGSDFTVAVHLLWIDDLLLLTSTTLLRNITSVRCLHIWNCRQLELIDGKLEQWFLKIQTTLERIMIHPASSLKSLLGCLKNLSSLHYRNLRHQRDITALSMSRWHHIF